MQVLKSMFESVVCCVLGATGNAAATCAMHAPMRITFLDAVLWVNLVPMMLAAT